MEGLGDTEIRMFHGPQTFATQVRTGGSPMNGMQVTSAGCANEIASAARTTSCCAAADAAAALADMSEYGL
jgi:hypothetical protein